MHTQQHDADAHGLDGRCGAGRIVNQPRHLFRQEEQPHKTGKGHDHGNPERHAGLVADAFLQAQGACFRNGRHQTDGQRRRKNRRQVHQRYSHAGQVTEQFCGVAHIKAGHFQPLGHNKQIQVGHDGQHQAGKGNRQRQLQET